MFWQLIIIDAEAKAKAESDAKAKAGNLTFNIVNLSIYKIN